MPTKLVIFILVIFSLNSFAKKVEPYEAYLDIEDNEKIQAFNDTRLNYSNCTIIVNPNGDKACKENVGILTNKIKITVLEDDISDFYFDAKEKFHPEVYAKVHFEYVNAIGQLIKDDGYIPSARIRRVSTEGRVQPIFSVRKEVPTESCPPKTNPIPKNVENKSMQINQSPAEDYFTEIDSHVEELKNVIGKCSEAKPQTLQPYDELLLGKLPTKTKNFTHQELIQIDSLARTLYGEMQGCYRFGLHYPMAVARIVLNRANEIVKKPYRESEFIKGEHNTQKPSVAKIVTSPSQFKVWQTEQNLEQILCPPTSPSKYWKKGAKPTPDDLAIWTNTLKIAIEAIKYPATFRVRTGEDDFPILFYTSNRDSFYDMIKVEKRMLNREFKDKCLNFWVENPKSKSKSKS